MNHLPNRAFVVASAHADRYPLHEVCHTEQEAQEEKRLYDETFPDDDEHLIVPYVRETEDVKAAMALRTVNDQTLIWLNRLYEMMGETSIVDFDEDVINLRKHIFTLRSLLA